MVARSARDVFGYGVRLFGYLLVSVVLGGALIAGGIGTIVTLEPGVLFGSASPGSYAPIAAGGVLAVFGVLVLTAGMFATVFALLADAVAVGLEASSAPAEARSTAERESADDERAEPADTTAEPPIENGEPAAEPGDGVRSDNDPLTGGTEPDDDPLTERGDDPLSGDSGTGDPLTGGSDGGDPFASSTDGSTSTQTSDEETWRREIESKLDDDETTGE
ncbi:hypothetical protein [Halapricum hydrolyticum]|uniref:Uncharacterized protein n=1 Tax=Halapricum hydrolyticum TaxID=2979991 RepID=A0AAE3I9J7_9EURY|nr:hypothetical protein [Halapricum hydrolyticum]MCU4717041.1 hypothetical protein [Halapricum hydrolyticum]MCU4725967.1 hypothetical protein [Halapricum hydrolyticum]